MPAIRKLSRRETVLVALVVLVAVALGWRWLRPTAPAATQRARAGEAIKPVPRIGLDRLEKRTASVDAGRRNLFAFGAARPAEPAPGVAAAATPTPPPVVAVQPPQGDAAAMTAAASLPPLNVKYVGTVENSAGAKLAVLVTDRQEVLTGQSGQVIANRYRVARIGLESVDLEDISTGQSRRIALRGN